MSRANLERKIKGFKVGQDTFSISHQQFVDDIVLYSIFNEESIKNLFNTIKIFETCSGLSINNHESEILGIDLEQSAVQKGADSIDARLDCGQTPLGLALNDKTREFSFWLLMFFLFLFFFWIK